MSETALTVSFFVSEIPHLTEEQYAAIRRHAELWLTVETISAAQREDLEAVIAMCSPDPEATVCFLCHAAANLVPSTGAAMKCADRDACFYRCRAIDRQRLNLTRLAMDRGAELAALRAKPVPESASERVKAIAGSLSRRRIAEEGWAEMSRAVDEIQAKARKIRGAAWDAIVCATREALNAERPSFSLPAHDGTTVTIDNNHDADGFVVRRGGARSFSGWDIDAAIGAFVGEILPPEAVYAPGGASTGSREERER